MGKEILSLFNEACTALGRDDAFRGLFAELDRALGKVVGHKLFTVLWAGADAGEVKRLYSNRPDFYPVSGTKSMTNTPWAQLVIRAGKPFIGRDAKDMKWAFPDHEVLATLGCVSALNIPVVVRGRTLGTVNLLHRAHWYQDRHIALVRPFAYLLAEPLASITHSEPAHNADFLSATV